MSDNGDSADVILGREKTLCSYCDGALSNLFARYQQADHVRSASYFGPSIAGAVLKDVAERALSYETQEALSEIECLIFASACRDIHDIAASFGDGSTSDSAYVAEQDWVGRAQFRSRRFKNIFPWLIGRFWRATSLYGTSPIRFASTVACLILFFSLVYAPAIAATAWLPRLEFHDEAFPTGFAGFWQGWGHSLYFSIITLTTVGFGDIRPTNLLARLVVGGEALLGVSLFGVLITLSTRRLPNRSSRMWPQQGQHEREDTNAIK
jgi:Ion channel